MRSPLGYQALLAEVRARGVPGQTYWIGIDGLGGSGKTTLAGRLAADLPGAVIIALDDFARQGIATWDHQLFADRVLDPLSSGHPARYQRWDHVADAGEDWVQVPTGVPVIAEGVSALDVAVRVPWALTVWVQTPIELRRARIEARDGRRLAERWRTDWIPQEERYFAAQRPDLRADVIVTG